MIIVARNIKYMRILNMIDRGVFILAACRCELLAIVIGYVENQHPINGLNAIFKFVQSQIRAK